VNACQAQRIWPKYVCVCVSILVRLRLWSFTVQRPVTTIEINVLKVKDSEQMYVSKKVMLDFYHPRNRH